MPIPRADRGSRRGLGLVLVTMLLWCHLAGCVSLSMKGGYRGPAPRPPELDSYYSVGRSYTSFAEVTSQAGDGYTIRRFNIETDAGQITVDYFQIAENSESLVLVFPVMGGKNFIENYFADYFVSHGIDTAIVHRSNEFKKPENFDRLETVLRDNLVRDRIALDFFEREFGKKKFGSFGISRGAINVAMTAGVDPRLKYNVLALGGTDIVALFSNSSERRIAKYTKAVTETKGITQEQMLNQLRQNIRTDPKRLTRHLDAENTLLMLGVLDSTVPFSLGMQLRDEIGSPETILLLADHFTSLLFTQIVKVFPPHKRWCLFPFDYVESEALAFYQRSFGMSGYPWQLVPLKMLQAPLNLVANLGREINESFSSDDQPGATLPGLEDASPVLRVAHQKTYIPPPPPQVERK